MLTALDAPESTFNNYERNFVAKIREYGWFRTSVFADGDEPAFSYTTGFWVTLGRPEIVVFDLPLETAHSVLWDLFNEAKAGRDLPLRTRVPDIFGRLDACFLSVDRTEYQGRLLSSLWFYRGDSFPCLQLVWPDRDNLFPWEPGFDPQLIGRQHDLADGGWGALQV